MKSDKCSYNPAENRLPKAHPLFQRFRLLKEVNELEIVGENSRAAAPLLALRLAVQKSQTNPDAR